MSGGIFVFFVLTNHILFCIVIHMCTYIVGVYCLLHYYFLHFSVMELSNTQQAGLIKMHYINGQTATTTIRLYVTANKLSNTQQALYD